MGPEVCIRSVMLYGAETWALTNKLMEVLRGCDRRMMRYLAGVRWQDRVISEEVARRCGIREIEVILRQRRLQWFGHVRRAGQDSVVRTVEVEGRRPVDRPRKTWRKCIEQDLNKLGLREEMAQDRREWRRVINCPTP